MILVAWSGGKYTEVNELFLGGKSEKSHEKNWDISKGEKQNYFQFFLSFINPNHCVTSISDRMMIIQFFYFPFEPINGIWFE